MIDAITKVVCLFAIYAFAGWQIEFVFRSVKGRQLVNPGFLHGPFLPIYGFGALIIIGLDDLMAGVNPVLKLPVFGVALTTLEYVVGVLLERLFGMRLWDYSKNRFNVRGRVCLTFAAAWSVLALIFSELVKNRVSGLLDMATPVAKFVFATSFLIYLTVDLLTSVASARRFQRLLELLRTQYQRLTEVEVSSAISRLKRLRGAFPHLNMQLFMAVKRNLHQIIDERLSKYLPMVLNQMDQRTPLEEEYLLIVDDILKNQEFQKLRNFRHHDSSIFDHCCRVSLVSYRVCKHLNVDFRSAARGGLLHDFFLYDWRNHDFPDLACEKLHGLEHPRIALKNSERQFVLNAIERDCIIKHMWPLTITPPRYKESWIVSIVDKVVASKEFTSYPRT